MWRYDQARTHARSRNESPNKSPVGEGESSREGKEIRGRGKFKARLLGGRKKGEEEQKNRKKPWTKQRMGVV